MNHSSADLGQRLSTVRRSILGAFDNEVQIQTVTGEMLGNASQSFLFNITPDEVVRRSTSGTPYPYLEIMGQLPKFEAKCDAQTKAQSPQTYLVTI